jgi:hypothetical protein
MCDIVENPAATWRYHVSRAKNPMETSDFGPTDLDKENAQEAHRLVRTCLEADLDLECAAAKGCFDTKSDGTVNEIWTESNGTLVWFVTRLMARLQPIATVPAVDILRWADEALKPKNAG